MKAAVYTRYGPPDVLTTEEIAAPELRPEDGKRVLIQVHASSTNPFDVLHRGGFLPIRPSHGWLRPRSGVLGIDVAGTILEVGRDVTRFKVGDAVYGGCFGSHAEIVRARENTLAPLPPSLTYRTAAALPTAAMTALQALRDVAHLQAGQKVLINGASGGVGHLAVQMAKAMGAHVTAVCSGPNVGWVKALGADDVIDYTRDDFTRSGLRYDVVLDSVGKRAYFDCARVLGPNGVFITENPLKVWTLLPQLGWSALVGDKRPKMHLAETTSQDLAVVSEWCDQGRLRPVIEEVYPLDQVAESHRHIEAGHTRGKVVIELRP